MSVEKLIIDTVRTATAEPVYFGMAPQPVDDVPSPMPVTIVNRIRTDWLNAFCGTDPNINTSGIQIDYYAETAEGARRSADAGRNAIIALPDDATLDSEVSFYDQVSRGWRVMQTWNIAEYQPSLA